MNEGWIKISRGIEHHWLWNDGQRLKWWIYLLLHAQWDDDKVLCGNQLIELKRGELIDSVNNLSSVWGCCRKTATQFLATLQKEDMISIKRSCNSKSVISICNYETYQCSEMDEGYNTIDNTSSKTGYNTGSKTTKEKEKKQKKEEKSKEIKKNSVLSSSNEEYKPLSAADFFDKGKEAWKAFYSWRTGLTYYWTAKDSRQMKELLGKVFEQFGLNDKSEVEAFNILKCFLASINDKWLDERLSVSTVNMKFNELMQQLSKKKKQSLKTDGVGFVDYRGS